MPGHDHSPGCAGCDASIAGERAARVAAEAANHAKDDFFLTLSHELRGPLNAIMSWVYLLRSGKLDAATELRALETIERNAKAEGRLISDMLDVSRVVGAKIRLDRRAVDLDVLVAETIETVRPAIDDSDVEVLVVPAAQSVGSINADPDRIRQVIENLLLTCATPRRRA